MGREFDYTGTEMDTIGLSAEEDETIGILRTSGLEFGEHFGC